MPTICAPLALFAALTLGCAMIGYGSRSAKAADMGVRAPQLGELSVTSRFLDEGSAEDGRAYGNEGGATFPLVAVPGKRYLQDATGRPFRIQGDSAWSLIADLTREEAEHYLDDRRARGFNTILVSLIEHRFAVNAPANAYHELPFRGQPFEALIGLTSWLLGGSLAHYGRQLATRFADFTKPNEAYFAHADWILRRAAEKGFLVLLAPCYAGYEGGSQGWYGTMVANGAERLRQYGEYLGRRYRDLDNILWVHAGDYDPPRKDLVRAVAEGIAAFDPDALHTAHGAPETAAIDYWQGESWLQVNNIYTYQSVRAAAQSQLGRPERMPFFLIEAAYENERDTSAQQLRRQAYQALLSGAAGQVFGNNPIWHFNGPGLYPVPGTWQQALASRGARSMTHLQELFDAIPWWRLEPDSGNRFLIDSRELEGEQAAAARSDDRSLAIVYLPSARAVTVDLTQLAGPKVEARWYNPASGRYSAVRGSPFPASGARRFEPMPHESGSVDWILIFESS